MAVNHSTFIANANPDFHHGLLVDVRPTASDGREFAAEVPSISRRTSVLAEACASRTHRRHQRCRPPVL